jgi:hypothetical protein
VLICVDLLYSLLALWQDITERKNAENELQRVVTELTRSDGMPAMHHNGMRD